MRNTVKKGMASLYLVAFTTLLLGIVTISFVEVMINESKESSNSDLSQSALDSALAGIEDAKNAIILYNSCLNVSPDTIPSGTNQKCGDIKTAMETGRKNHDCDIIAKVIGQTPAAAVNISENGDESTLNQAYTCVTIANDAIDYRSVLDESIRSKVVPIDSVDKNTGIDADSSIVAVEIQWYSSAADENNSEALYMSQLYSSSEIIPLGNKNSAAGTGKDTTIPILNFELIQTDNEFTASELDVNNESNTGTDHAIIMLYPNKTKENGEKGTFVSARNLLDASNKSSSAALRSSADKNASVVPKLVSCDYENGSRCRATIQLPATYRGNTTNYDASNASRSNSTFILRVSLPYGGPRTDFSLKLCTKLKPDGKTCEEPYADFNGAQYIVDSTGRAGTLYRRITARIETAPNTVFPEYAVQTSGENATIEKRFYVTENCWTADGKGNFSQCPNNGDASTDFPE